MIATPLRCLNQTDAAAGRRRGLKTAAGRAEIARTVLRIKAENAAAAAAAAETPQGGRLRLDASECGAGAQGADGAGTWAGDASSPEIGGLDGDGEGGGSPDAASTAAGAALPTAEGDKSALADEAVQLFRLFDGESPAPVSNVAEAVPSQRRKRRRK